MKTVSAREANQQFSRLLGEVAEGQEVVITMRGKPVATLGPYRGASPMTPERKAAIERMIKRMRKGYDLVGIRVNRHEIYDRGMGDTTNTERVEACPSASTATSSSRVRPSSGTTPRARS